MEIIKEIFNINNDVFGIIKVIVAISGFVALLIKVKEAFSDKQRKQSLKTDLEILQISKGLNSEKAKYVSKKVESEIDYLYDNERYTSNSLLNFILGLIVSIGFSFWTVSLFQNSKEFNPWTILTMFVAGAGFTMLFDNKKKERKGEFFRIEFYDSSNFKIGIIIGVISMICSVALILINKCFTWGLFVAVIFTLIGFLTIIRNIRFNKIKNKA